MRFIFSRVDVDYLYKKFVSDNSYLEGIFKNLEDKSEGYKEAYYIALKSLNKKYSEYYKVGDLELGLDEFS